MGVVQPDSYRKDFPVFREKSKELHLHRRHEIPCQRPQSCLLFYLRPKSTCNGLIQVPCGCCVMGKKNNDYEGFHSGYLLKQRGPEQQTASNLPDPGDLLFEVFVTGNQGKRLQHLTSGVMAATQTSTINKWRPLEQALECRTSLSTQPGCSSWHPPSDSPVTHLWRAGAEATLVSARALLGMQGPGACKQAEKPWHFPGRRQQSFAMPLLLFSSLGCMGCSVWQGFFFCHPNIWHLCWKYHSLPKYLKRLFPF